MPHACPDAPFTAAVLTVSDRGSRGERPDGSGPAVADLLAENGFSVVDRAIVPDGVEPVAAALRGYVARDVALVVTTGGTGFSPRDLTPEATLQVAERPVAFGIQ